MISTLGWVIWTNMVINHLIPVIRTKGVANRYHTVNGVLVLLPAQLAWVLGPWWAVGIAFVCGLLTPIVFLWLGMRLLLAQDRGFIQELNEHLEERS